MDFVNSTTKQTVFSDIKNANTFISRFSGLMGRKEITRGVFFDRCNWIHTFFMRAPIDVVYFDKKMCVKKVEHHLQPWKLSMPVFKASSVLELPAGLAKEKNIQLGDQFHVGD